MGEKMKRFTAKDMRQMVADLENNLHHGMERVVIASPKLIEMVRQAAETEEKFKKLKAQAKAVSDDLSFTQDVLTKATSRLDEVVKVAEKARSGISCTACRSNCRKNDELPECESSNMRCEKQVYDEILRAARGE